MADENITWKRMAFKKNKVWVASHQDGSLMEKNGKVLIKYQRDQDYEYWVHKNSIKPLDSLDSHSGRSHKTASKGTKKQHKDISTTDMPPEDLYRKDTIYIYTDGASSGNPGPAGIGVWLRYEKHEKEISKYIGITTNNVAELEAIRAGLLEVKNPDIPVIVFRDSSYAYGVLTQGWKAKKTRTL